MKIKCVNSVIIKTCKQKKLKKCVNFVQMETYTQKSSKMRHKRIYDKTPYVQSNKIMPKNYAGWRHLHGIMQERDIIWKSQGDIMVNGFLREVCGTSQGTPFTMIAHIMSLFLSSQTSIQGFLSANGLSRDYH